MAALENIIEERAKKGPFIDLFDFCKRVDLRTANKRVIESLICAGAFDTLPGNRAQKYHEISHIIDLALAHKKDALTGQMDIFGLSKKTSTNEGYAFEPRAEWPDREKLEKEHEVAGFYISSHPLETYKKQCAWFGVETFENALHKAKSLTREYTTVNCALLKSRKDIVTKKGDRMAFLQCEDMSGSAEIIVFPKTFTKCEQWLGGHHVFVIKGVVDTTNELQCKIKAQDIVPIELALNEWPNIENITLTVPEGVEEKIIESLKERLVHGRTPLHVIFKENGKTLRLTTKEKVLIDMTTAQELESENITIKCSL
jgi:DNA polymerase-3 subunit alpha